MSDENIYLLQLTTGVVTAYLGNHRVPTQELPNLIRSVHETLCGVSTPPEAPGLAPALTAAQVRRSIKPEALISFEDHKPYKQLRRHLTTHGMTPAEYRGKWGLPADYPMVAADYSAARSALAKAAGLGKKRLDPPVVMAPPAAQLAKARVKGKIGLFGKRETK